MSCTGAGYIVVHAETHPGNARAQSDRILRKKLNMFLSWTYEAQSYQILQNEGENNLPEEFQQHIV